eukprot:6347348-Prorocentrum_lima.AAC.1
MAKHKKTVNFTQSSRQEEAQAVMLGAKDTTTPPPPAPPCEQPIGTEFRVASHSLGDGFRTAPP